KLTKPQCQGTLIGFFLRWLRSKFSLNFSLVLLLPVCGTCMQLIWMLYATYIDLYSTMAKPLCNRCAIFLCKPLRVVTRMCGIWKFKKKYLAACVPGLIWRIQFASTPVRDQ